ncbi:hypothetical protein P280DRAFT_63413 [Massarina eburnea CBS 473.64]|uniref:Uncharacterized protein n=1 Tax=Massarina eburnea CBS 473.64 TaxID=1395130 RepID=A0A6A6RTB8_9PLEO|nr:hypothetical protein P280DRAFT_63413 [Massarina eburnea CBS 473.64]
MDFIHRHQRTTDETPPWNGIVFKLPVDSDELAEKLKIAYPNCRTLRERKHQATSDFFAEELKRMQSKDLTPFTTTNSAEPSVSDYPQDASKAYSQAFSDRSRPQSASGYTSPSVAGSVDSPLVERAKPSISISTSPRMQPSTAPTMMMSTNAQQFVWSAHDGKSLRPKTKRKMTLEERSAYKETRKRGACDKCRRQKGRCTHMTEGEHQPSGSEVANRLTKRRISAGPDANQDDGLKSVKIEHASDVHYIAPETSSNFSSISTPSSHQGHANEHSEVTRESMVNNTQQWEEEPGAGPPSTEYVSTFAMDSYGNPSQGHLNHGHEPWSSPYASQNPSASLILGYSRNSSINTEVFPTLVGSQPTDEYSISPGYPYYGETWSNQNLPMGSSGPT